MRRVYTGRRIADPARVPSLLRFGSWIGGDRDGNPFVSRRPPSSHCICICVKRWPTICAISINCGMYSPLRHIIKPARSLRRNLASPTAGDQSATAFGDHLNALQHEPYRRKLYMIRCRLRAQPERGLRANRNAGKADPNSTAPGYLSEHELLQRPVPDPRFADQSWRCQHRQRRTAGSDPSGGNLWFLLSCISTCVRNPARHSAPP